ncbi:flavin-containing monooxygenase [Streptomyces reniochalinae]|uniref:NAD(P)/FAD-dependent oxidoreductase n=1 Tax=Streptomyces reniochalinae TaxID=2250578 RepID=A0A367ECG6_9ACTN|nr:NAD(P)/FAD-dependent oxidoreductase [Streptomyces reniochalinae]RCG14930.1 NAD(P)/FAD-dependent oxidoreductase [Streptomyces reniochalinae]
MLNTRRPVIVVGGGQSGLAAAHALRAARLPSLVLEAAEEAVGSWSHYYDSLALFSPARFSTLPGARFPGNGEQYPRRDEVVEYLRSYAQRFDAVVRYGQRVKAVTMAPDGGFALRAESGTEYEASAVIAANGYFGNPYRPELPGLREFAGTVLHACEYRAPKAFEGQRVVVVGGGNSAMQIAADLAGVARVTLASRAPLRWQAQRIAGRDLHWWLTRTGIDSAPIGRWLGGKSMPIIDDGRYRAALESGNPDHRKIFNRLHENSVEWQDGTRENLDTVVLATGYRPDMRYLAETGALDTKGIPLQRAGLSTAVRGLGYVGLEYQRTNASASVRGVGRDAAYVVRKLHRRGR